MMSIWDELDEIYPVVGPIETEREEDSADQAIFLDGDLSNDDPDNVLDIDYFENIYSYEQWLEDFEDRCFYMDQSFMYKEAIDRIKSGEPVQSTIDRLEEALRRCAQRRCDRRPEDE